MYTIFDIISSEQIIPTCLQAHLLYKHAPLSPPSLSKEYTKGITHYIYIFTSIIPTINARPLTM